MIKDMTKAFKIKMDDMTEYEKMILNNYMLKDGLYIKFDIDSEPVINEENHIIINTKKQSLEESQIKNPELFKWFLKADYYSVILNDDTHKAIDLPAKKILSTNWMTLFIKKDIFPVIGKDPIEKEKLLQLMANYYEKLRSSEEKLLEVFLNSEYIGKKPSKEEKEQFLQGYFKEETAHIRSDYRKSALECCKNYIIGKFDRIVEAIKNFSSSNEFNGYVKIFFDIPMEVYKIEGSIYTLSRIFNVNDYNIFDNGNVMGLPSNNITTNSKKPYMLLRAMRCNVPYRAGIRDAVASKNLFEWLIMQGKFKEIKFDYEYNFDGTEAHRRDEPYFSIQINQDTEIVDFDNVPFDAPKLKFCLDNVLYLTEKSSGDNVEKERLFIAAEDIKDYKKLQEYFGQYFFNNRFLEYTKAFDPDIKTNEFTGQMKVLYNMSKEALFDFFSKGIPNSISVMVKRLTMDLITEQLKHTVQGNNLSRAAKAFNLRASLLKYFEGDRYDMADKIKSNIDGLKEKLNSDGLVICESDEEFYFTAGQLAYFILSQSESDKKNYGLFEPILNVKNSSQLKKKIREVFMVYKHAINVGNVKFKNAMGMVMGYETEEQITDKMQEMLLAGLMANNIFYSK